MRFRPSAMFAGSVALLLPLFTHPSVLLSPFSLRYAALAIVVAVGGVLLVNLVRSGAQIPAIVALGLAGWALLSAALSPQPAMSLWGLFGLGTGALFVCALAASWAVGLTSGEGGRALVERGLLISATANAGVTVAQTLANLATLDLPLYEDNRAPGLLGNPVFLGGLLAAALWLVLHRLGSSWRWVPVVVLFGAALQLSGSRFSLAVAVLTLPAALLTKALGGRKVLIAAVALVCGIVSGSQISEQRGSLSGTQRAFSQPVFSDGLANRVENWKTAPAALRDRPLVGWGPNRYGQATSARRTLAVAEGRPETLYTDAHNLIVEYAVTTGLGGLALLLALIVLSLRASVLTSPLTGFALLALAGHMLQPQNVALTPVAFLALGAGMTGLRLPPLLPPPRWIVAGAAGLGLAAAATCVYGVYLLEQARLDFTTRPAQQASDLLPPWPEPRAILGNITAFHGISRGGDAATLARSRSFLLEAAQRDPTDPALWNSLAEAELRDGLDVDAGRHFGLALQRNPWSVRALNGLGQIALNAGDEDEAARLFRKSLRALPDQLEIAAHVRRIEADG